MFQDLNYSTALEQSVLMALVEEILAFPSLEFELPIVGYTI